MDSILVTPKNLQEFQLISAVLSKMKIKTKLLSSEKKEDLGLATYTNEESIEPKLQEWKFTRIEESKE